MRGMLHLKSALYAAHQADKFVKQDGDDMAANM